ncbi:MAG: histidinol-phosphatase [Candidatus Schekmanbacteria bacterium RBG_13_48_7]|uniref:DNA polymerase beta n=1 Tax=Candidatus Schekmanbacteria bacterium RBG_13_48_7 TaxID=1817878 RepID=A0A1F7RRI9_9BACT|nr:MAG: histidinol-phosphatase [Candidatus Schekmanbacteria bacterium RBG_13_48_7]
MDKKDIASILKDISVLLDLKGENPFKSKAYVNAARIIETVDIDLEQAVRDGTLDTIKGIGKGLAEKITEIILTGESAYYKELKSSFPEELLQLLDIPGLGPKKVKVLYEQLGIKTIGELEYACQENRLIGLPGFGQKSQTNILQGIEHLKKYRSRFLYPVALENAHLIMEYLRDDPKIGKIEVAGSLRRKMETVKDIDLLVSTKYPEEVSDKIAKFQQVETVIAKGDTKTSITLDSGINADLRVVTAEQFPYALHHFTGSKEHNTAMRARAKKSGYKMNEYGLFKEEKLVPCRDETAIFIELGLDYIPPELRENLGEIEAAEQKNLPVLIEEKDISGIFHVHTTFSDGSNTLEELVKACQQKGWKYIGISDHSKTAAYAGGLSIDQIYAQHESIDRLNSNNKKFQIFKGIESDILTNGDLDYPDNILEKFDFIIASVHSNFRMSKKDMTDRIIKALNNPHTTMLGHPTGRLLLSREAYELDMEEVLETAAAMNVMIEINSHPYRLDLDWREVIKAKDKGIMLSVNPDAHNIEGLDDFRYGVGIARKGWLSRDQILNCMDIQTCTTLLKRRKIQ